MKLAYIVLVHTAPDQAVRLIRTLDAPDTEFFVHVDAAAPASVYDTVGRALSGRNNVHFLRRFASGWGQFGIVAAGLHGIARILESRARPDFTFLVSGQDYPIKRRRDVERALASGKSFVQAFSMPAAKWAGNGGMDRLHYWHFPWRGRFLAFPKRDLFANPVLKLLWNAATRLHPAKRELPTGLVFHGGEHWWCLNHACLEYLHAYAARNEATMLFFRRALLPDEIVYQSVLLSSPLADQIERRTLTHTDWIDGKRYPNWLTCVDIDRLRPVEHVLARKFSLEVDPAVLDLVDRELLS